MTDIYKKRLMNLFDTASDGLWIMHENYCITFYNLDFYNRFNMDLKESKLGDWYSLVHPDDITNCQSYGCEKHPSAWQSSKQKCQYRVLKKNGEYCWIESVSVLKEDEQGCYIVGHHRDITALKCLESSINKLAFEDELTGLPNYEKLRADLKDRNDKTALVYIFLPRFNPFTSQNESKYLLSVVNEIEKYISRLAEHHCKCYRSSIDTFSIVINGLASEEELAKFIQYLILLCFIEPNHRSITYAKEFYIGAYFCNDDQEPAESIISYAAQTCEYAYRHESNRWAICNIVVYEKVRRFLFIEQQLETAITENHLSVFFQPIINMKTSKLISFEALVRWENSQLGEIMPSEFISVAERKGLITLLGEKVLAQASIFISTYNKSWNSKVKVNVNVSVLQLHSTDFPNEIKLIVESNGASAEDIVLELTESVLLEDKDYASKSIDRLKELGFSLAMDDFGSGHSSTLSFFKFPFDQLKIDRELVYRGMNDLNLHTYLMFLYKTCCEQGIIITLEGIETIEQLSHYYLFSDSSVQGYLVSKPLSVEAALQYRTKAFYWQTAS